MADADRLVGSKHPKAESSGASTRQELFPPRRRASSAVSLASNSEDVNSRGSGRRLILLPEVLHKTGLHRSTAYALIKDGLFPKPVSLTPKRVAWVEAEVDDFIAGRIAERDQLAKAG